MFKKFKCIHFLFSVYYYIRFLSNYYYFCLNVYINIKPKGPWSVKMFLNKKFKKNKELGYSYVFNV